MNSRIATDRGPTSAFIKTKIGKLNLEGLNKKKNSNKTSNQSVDWTLDVSPQQHHSKAVLQEKLRGAQCFESVNPRVFSYIRISIKRLRFPYCPREKVRCQGQQGTAREWPCIHPLLERANSDMFTPQPWGLSRGLCCHFLSHFWHHLSPGRLGEKVAVDWA